MSFVKKKVCDTYNSLVSCSISSIKPVEKNHIDSFCLSEVNVKIWKNLQILTSFSSFFLKFWTQS